MENIIYVLLAGFIISLASLSGVLLVKSHKKIAQFVENNLEILSALSGGIFLFTSFNMFKTSLEILNWEKALISFFIGILLFIILQKVLNSHRHKGNTDDHTHEHTKKSALKILIGDSIHNVADGLFLIASFGTSFVIGVSTSISIFIHEVPQEISEFIVLRKSGYSVREISFKNYISALSIFIGIGLGLFFMKTKMIQGYLIGVSSIFFLGVIFTDLFPIQTILKRKNKIKIISAFFIGILFMTLIMFILGHSH